MSNPSPQAPKRPPRPKPRKKQLIRAALARQAQESRGVEFPEPEDVPTLKPMG